MWIYRHRMWIWLWEVPPVPIRFNSPHSPSMPRRVDHKVPLTQIRANFCNLTDSADRIIFTADYLGTDAGTRQDWTKRLVDAGSTHLVVSPTGGDYPGSPIGRFNLYDKPEQFASEIRAILNTPSADGLALTNYYSRQWCTRYSSTHRPILEFHSQSSWR